MEEIQYIEQIENEIEASKIKMIELRRELRKLDTEINRKRKALYSLKGYGYKVKKYKKTENLEE